ISVLSVLMTFMAYSTYHFVHPHYRNNWELYKFRAKEFLFDSVRGGTPNLLEGHPGLRKVLERVGEARLIWDGIARLPKVSLCSTFALRACLRFSQVKVVVYSSEIGQELRYASVLALRVKPTA
ncbi:hypothetical protein, partial [Fibrobacter succinogenes]|uniref:hypothetical protein n=1 Tax=Fibrobacter succinogenes TaxID=833 RepID=UPI0019D5435B